MANRSFQTITFPHVGFYSRSFTDGVGTDEECYTVDGDKVYYAFADIQGLKWWSKECGEDIKIGFKREGESASENQEGGQQ